MRDEKIELAAPVEVVWPIVSDPVRMAVWQPKIASVTPVTAGGARQGARYRIVFRMNGREQPFTTTIETFDPPRRIALLHVGQKDRRARESFELVPICPDRTRVVHEIDLSMGGLPWYLRPLIAFITRFGQPQGDGPLDHLKRHVESQGSQRSSISPVSPAAQNR